MLWKQVFLNSTSHSVKLLAKKNSELICWNKLLGFGMHSLHSEDDV